MGIRIEAALIETSRLGELAAFYREGLDLGEPAEFEEDQIGFQIGEFYVGLEQVENPGEPPGRVSLWFTVEDVPAVYARLLELGATPKAAPEQIEDEVIASVFDPDGNVVGLISESPE